MTVNVAFSRAASAGLILLGITASGATLLWLALANRQALVEERDAKGGFVARSLATGNRAKTGDGAPPQELAVLAEADTLAAARVEALVRATLTTGGCVVLSSRAEIRTGEATRGADGRIAIQAVVQGSMESLQASLFGLETGAPLVLVDAVEIRRQDEGEPQGRAPGTPVLTATLTLSAFWKRGRPEKG